MFRRMLLPALALSTLLGCATYTGAGTGLALQQAQTDAGWILIADLPEQYQHTDWDCGLAAWSMVARYWKVAPDAQHVSKMLEPIAAQQRPIRAAELRDLAIQHGMLGFVFAGESADLVEQLKKGRPLIVGMMKPTIGGQKAHYEVVIGVHPTRRLVMTFDPALGYRQNSLQGFEGEWRGSGAVTILLLPSSLAMN